MPAPIRRCDDLPATITHIPVAAVLVLNTPDDELYDAITHVPAAAVLVLNTPDDGRFAPLNM